MTLCATIASAPVPIVLGRRDELLLHKDDLSVRDLMHSDLVEIEVTTYFTDALEDKFKLGSTAIENNIPRNCAATFYSATNVLAPPAIMTVSPDAVLQIYSSASAPRSG